MDAIADIRKQHNNNDKEIISLVIDIFINIIPFYVKKHTHFGIDTIRFCVKKDTHFGMRCFSECFSEFIAIKYLFQRR